MTSLATPASPYRIFVDVSACLGLYMYVKTSKYRGDSLAVVVAAILLIWLLALAVLQRFTNCELSLRRNTPSLAMDLG